METCSDAIGAGARTRPEVPRDGFGRWERLEDWTRRLRDLRESVDSEWSAAREALAMPGAEGTRKWLGWALYRLAARVNPEIRD